jgi:phosphotriesterase-related protein
MTQFGLSRLSRRDALRSIVGGGIGLSATAILPASFGLDDLATPAANSIEAAEEFPKGAIIRTVLKDVPPNSIGATLFHEHLHANSTLGLRGGPGAPQPDRHFTEDFDVMVDELKAAARDGVTCIVEAGHSDQGRRVPYVRQLSLQSGVAIVVSGGYHSQPSYPKEVLLSTEDDLVEEFVRYASAERWGAFGEIGFWGNESTPDERKVARAIGRAHLRTRLPIFTHTNGTQIALQQLDLYESVGVKPQNIVIGHVGNLVDPDVKVQKELAKRGAFCGFDRAVRTEALDAQMVPMIMAMIEAGYAKNILLSSDIGSDPKVLKANGGPGYAKTLTVFVPKLRQAGAKDDTLRQITVDNPRRFLAFVPPKA